MASEHSIAVRSAEARGRINSLVLELQKAGVKVEGDTPSSKDAGVKQAQELEYFASVMESVLSDIKTVKEPVKPKATGKK